MAVTHKKGKTPEKITINKIEVVHSGFRTQDIGTWKQAILAFRNKLNPSRTALYDLYEDLLLDGQVESAWGKRRDGILNKELVCIRDGVEDEELGKLLNTADMRNMLSDLLDSILWGHSLIQVNSITYDRDTEGWHISYDLIPRKHVHPESGWVSRSQGMASPDWEYRQPPLSNYMIEAGRPDDMGLLAVVAQYVIYKRGGLGDWAQFAEMFGMPFREMIYDDYDEDTRAKLEAMLQDWNGAQYSVHPRSAELKIHDTAGSTGSKDVYYDLIDACDAAISKAILGNTLTTEQGDNGARSLGEVHKEEEDSKKASDMRFILAVLNTSFRAVLKRFGFDITGKEIAFKDGNPDWYELQSKWNVIAGMKGEIPMDDDWIYETMGVPKPEDYDSQKEAMALQRAFTPFEMPVQENAGTGKMTIKERIARFFRQAPQGASNGRVRITGSDTLADRVWNGEADYWDTELFRRISENLLEAIHHRFPEGVADSITYNAPDDVFRTALEMNIWHFSAAKTLAEIQALNQVLRESKGYEDFRQRAGNIQAKFEGWQRTEYQSAINCAEGISTYRRLKQQVKVFPYWEYKTAGDSKVREEHAALDGLVLLHSDPLWDKIYPPNGWNCRCYVVPRMAAEEADYDKEAQHDRADFFLQSKEWQRAEKSGWGINRAIEAKVFEANQFYIEKFPDYASDYMDKIPPSDWKIKGNRDILQKESKATFTKYEGTADEYWKENKTVIDDIEYLVVEDYLGRKWRMDKKSFAEHTTNRRKNRATRVDYLSEIQTVTMNPDEVWLRRTDESFSNKSQKLDNFVFIKYYNECTLAIAGKIKDDHFVFATWFPVMSDNVRRGILINKRQWVCAQQ